MTAKRYAIACFCLAACLVILLCACRPAAAPAQSSAPPIATAAPSWSGASPAVTAALQTATHIPTAPPRVVVVVLPTRTPIVIPTSTLSACMARARFGEQAESPYVLPYPVGESYRIIQGYCYPHGGHANQLAYDFSMPVGAPVTAARSGVVVELRDGSPDDGGIDYIGDHNYLMIQHRDFTTAFYAHLKQDSIIVQVGETVEIGQQIALSGNSGATGGRAHLHFGVYTFYPVADGYDEPIVFRNAAGPLDARGGMRANIYYEALPYDALEP